MRVKFVLVLVLSSGACHAPSSRHDESGVSESTTEGRQQGSQDDQQAEPRESSAATTESTATPNAGEPDLDSPPEGEPSEPESSAGEGLSLSQITTPPTPGVREVESHAEKRYLHALLESSEEIQVLVEHVRADQQGRIEITLNVPAATFPRDFVPAQVYVRFYGARGGSPHPATYLELPTREGVVVFDAPKLAMVGEQPFFNVFVEGAGQDRKVNHAITEWTHEQVSGWIEVDEPSLGEGRSYRLIRPTTRGR